MASVSPYEMLRAIKRVRRTLGEWVPSALGLEQREPVDEFPYVPPANRKRAYMEERWTALPPRRRKRARGTAGDDDAGAAPAARGSDGAATPETPAAGAVGTFAARAADNAAAVAHAVAARAAANAAGRPSVPSAPAKVFLGDWEHLDHTADVQFHAWGAGLEAALENLALCFFDYVTELATIDEDAAAAASFDVAGNDLDAFVFRFLDELLYRFSAEAAACRTVAVTLAPRTVPDAPYAATVATTGERFDLAKHPQGTEVKAITYSNMQVHTAPDGRVDIFVIVDI